MTIMGQIRPQRKYLERVVLGFETDRDRGFAAVAGRPFSGDDGQDDRGSDWGVRASRRAYDLSSFGGLSGLDRERRDY
jgi:hypothetical protein